MIIKLNFNEQINKICKSAENQLNALIRLKSFLVLKEKEVLVNSYCPLVWMLSQIKLKVYTNEQINCNTSLFISYNSRKFDQH